MNIGFMAIFICLLIGDVAKNSQNDIKYSVGNINPQLIKNIENEWINIVKSITIIVDLIDNKYRLSSNKVISSYNALIPLIYFVYKNKLSTVNNDNSILMKKWLIKILLNGIFGGQADTMLYISKNGIDKSEEKVFPFYEIIFKAKICLQIPLLPW